MKKIRNISAILIAIALGVASCQTTQTVAPSTAGRIQNGSWKISLYNDSGTDETAHFTGYQLTFNSNGTVSAVKGELVFNGSWSIGSDDSQQKLILNFGETVPFDELSDDWHITEETDIKFVLDDVSGGNGGTDFLTIEKD